MAVPEPDLDQCLLLVLAEADADDFTVQLIAHHAEDEVFPYLVEDVCVYALLCLFELQEKAAALRPIFPLRLAFLLEEHQLHVHLVLRGQFQGVVVLEELFQSIDGGDGFELLIVRLVLCVFSSSFGVELPGLDVDVWVEMREGDVDARS